MAAQPPPPKGGGMSLYANLLNPNTDAAASISGAPVLYDTGERDDSAAKKEVNPSLRFQPIRRPQVNQKKAPKPAFPKVIPAPPPPVANSTSTTENKESVPVSAGTPPTPGLPPPQPARSTLADWAATEEDEYLWAAAAEKRQRGGRKAAKKRKKLAAENQRETDWDEIYDPARPTNVDEYLRSDERIREVQEWKAVLYAHRRKARRDSYEESDESDEDGEKLGVGNQFAPPADFSFAPPPMSPPPPPPPRDSPSAAAPIPTDATGDDVYARRLAMSGMASVAAAMPTPAPAYVPTPPPPLDDGATISRGPVRYEAPPQPAAMDIDEDDEYDVEDVDLPPSFGLGTSTNAHSGGNDAGEGSEGEGKGEGDQPRSNRPGQKDFAQRLMSKYGWTAGSGLGASSSGIVNPLSVKIEKRRKRPDAEGGGFAEPGGRGRVVGGRTAATSTSADGDAGKFGAMSEVIVLRNMLEGMENLQEEINQGLGQEIGEECGNKYGRVERLYIDVEGRQVFIKFTDQVSALRAVNALEGRVFNGNAIAARFWDAEKFERGEYS